VPESLSHSQDSNTIAAPISTSQTTPPHQMPKTAIGISTAADAPRSAKSRQGRGAALASG